MGGGVRGTGSSEAAAPGRAVPEGSPCPAAAVRPADVVFAAAWTGSDLAWWRSTSANCALELQRYNNSNYC